MKPRRPLSDTPEEEAFLRADERTSFSGGALLAKQTWISVRPGNDAD